MNRLRNRRFFLPLLAVSVLAAGCQKEEPPAPAPPPKGPAPAVAEKPADVAPAAPVEPESPLADARDQLKVYDFGDETMHALESLRGYVLEFPKAKDAPDAAILAAKTELDLLVRAVRSKDEELASRLGRAIGADADGIGRAAQAVEADVKKLFANLGWPENVDERVALAVEEALAVATNVAAVESAEGATDPDRILAVATGTGPFAGAARYFTASRLVEAFHVLADRRADDLASAFGVPAARLVCPSCEKAAREQGGDVTAALLAGEPGVACPAIRESVAGMAPQKAWELLAAECEPSYYGLQSKDQLLQMAGANFIPMRAFGMLSTISAAPPLENDPMARLIAQILAPATEGEHAAMTVSLLPPYAAPKDDAEDQLRVHTLKHLGPPWHSSHLETIVVDHTGVRTMVRPVVSLDTGVITLAGDAEEHWPGKEVVTHEALLAPLDPAAPPETEHPGQAALGQGLDALARSAAAILFKFPTAAGQVPPVAQEGQPAPPRAAWTLVDAATDAPVFAAVAQGMVKAGYPRAWLVTGVGPHAYVPVALGSPELLRSESVDVRYKRPVMVNLTADGADVFPPSGSLGSARGGREGAPDALPEAAQQWYRGEDVFKVSVPLPKKKDSIAAVAQTARFLAGRAEAGNVFLVSAEQGVPASRVVALAAALSKAPGPEWDGASGIFPGLECGPPQGRQPASPEEAPEVEAPPAEADAGASADKPKSEKPKEEEPAEQQEPAGGVGPCPTHVVVLFPGLAVPSASNLTKEPVKKQVETPPPKETVKEEASAAFCNKADIKRVMGGRSGAFKFCYERELQQNPDLEGKVVLRFEIDRQGDPRNISIAQSTLKNDAVHECLKANVKKLMFEKPDGGICAVQWPIVFKN